MRNINSTQCESSPESISNSCRAVQWYLCGHPNSLLFHLLLNISYFHILSKNRIKSHRTSPPLAGCYKPDEDGVDGQGVGWVGGGLGAVGVSPIFGLVSRDGTFTSSSRRESMVGVVLVRTIPLRVDLGVGGTTVDIWVTWSTIVFV